MGNMKKYEITWFFSSQAWLFWMKRWIVCPLLRKADLKNSSLYKIHQHSENALKKCVIYYKWKWRPRATRLWIKSLPKRTVLYVARNGSYHKLLNCWPPVMNEFCQHWNWLIGFRNKINIVLMEGSHRHKLNGVSTPSLEMGLKRLRHKFNCYIRIWIDVDTREKEWYYCISCYESLFWDDKKLVISFDTGPLRKKIRKFTIVATFKREAG